MKEALRPPRGVMRIPFHVSSLRLGQPLTSCPSPTPKSQDEQLWNSNPRRLPPLPLVNTEESDGPGLEKQAFVFINQREEVRTVQTPTSPSSSLPT